MTLINATTNTAAYAQLVAIGISARDELNRDQGQIYKSSDLERAGSLKSASKPYCSDHAFTAFLPNIRAPSLFEGEFGFRKAKDFRAIYIEPLSL